MMDFSNNIKSIRDKSGLTQAQFASKLGLSTPTVAAWENGAKKPSYDVLIQIATIFNVSLDWLCGINKLNDIKIDTWADMIKIVHTLLSYEHLDVYAKNEERKSSISFDRFLCDPDAYPVVDEDDYNKYIVLKELQISAPWEMPSQEELLSFTNPVYIFIQEYQKMKALLAMDSDYTEIYNLWLEKQFEKYDTPIWNKSNNYNPDDEGGF